jgi:hypothetical protein
MLRIDAAPPPSHLADTSIVFGEVSARATRVRVVIPLRPAVRLRVTVLDAEQHPVAGASVRAFVWKWGESVGPPTDSRGRTELTVPHYREDRVTVVAPGWGSTDLALDAAPVDCELVVQGHARLEPDDGLADVPFVGPPAGSAIGLGPLRSRGTDTARSRRKPGWDEDAVPVQDWTASVVAVDRHGRGVPHAALHWWDAVQPAAGVQDLVVWTDALGRATLSGLRGRVILDAAYGSRSARATLEPCDPVVRLRLE